VGRSSVTSGLDVEGDETARSSASQRGRSTRVPDLRVEEGLLSRWPRVGTSSSKVQGTFCSTLVGEGEGLAGVALVHLLGWRQCHSMTS